MTCQHCRAADAVFGVKVATRDRRRYRRRGPDRTTGEIIAVVKGLGLRDASLLDVGAGVGVIHHELLDDGVAAAVHVEAATAYLEAARAETEARGHAGRVRFVQGDFVDVAGGVDPADLVTLDRVVCCYPDCATLLAAAAGKSRVALALSYPRQRWYVRLVIALQNLVRRLRRDPFRTFVHSPVVVGQVLDAAGLRRVAGRDFLVWRVELYRR
ncbi:MAG TPA: methyltransferase domain-containing protein [Gemmatimonadales bacterium]|nr:methyltransferase domain-containing protein [Gemmatimonadales bacterium]